VRWSPLASAAEPEPLGESLTWLACVLHLRSMCVLSVQSCRHALGRPSVCNMPRVLTYCCCIILQGAGTDPGTALHRAPKQHLRQQTSRHACCKDEMLPVTALGHVHRA